VPLALQVLRQIPQDHETRFLLVANYARLGLVTAARDELSRLPEELSGEAIVREMAQALAQLPDDRVPLDERVKNAAAGLEVFRSRSDVETASCLADAFEAWREAERQVDVFRTIDGNILRRSAASGAWLRFADDRGGALQSIPTRAGPGTSNTVSPAYIEGVNPPWMLRTLFDRTPTNPDGSATRISVVCTEPAEVLDALAACPLDDIIQSSRVEWFIGKNAGDELRAKIEGTNRLGALVPGIVATTGGTRSNLKALSGKTLGEIVQALSEEAEASAQRSWERVRAMYAGRDVAFWRERFGGKGPASQACEPLRFLLVTTRFSTFLKHACADFSDALKAAGCDATVLIEPDDAYRLSSLAYTRAIETTKPDCVVLINFTRRQLETVIPPELPVVTWLQDAMPHLFDGAQGKAMGPLDFVIGHLHQELFTKFGYPRERMMHTPVVASERKFHAGPVSADLTARHACEIAYVSHQSEPPERTRDRLIREAKGLGPQGPAIVKGMYDRVVAAATQRVTERNVLPAIREIVKDVMTSTLGRPPGDRECAVTEYAVARPIADRAIRHQMLGWASAIARRRGWRLHLYGRGWDRHPTLAAYAKGELAHDEDLRASYAGAAAQLHASIHGNLHQRVMECALSGGLPLVRVKFDDFWAILDNVTRRMTLRCEPYASAVSDRSVWMAGLDWHEAAATVGLFHRWRLDHPGDLRFTSRLRDAADDASRFERATLLPEDAIWLCGDLSETGFDSESSLEGLLEKAVNRTRWRESLSTGIAGRVRHGLTYDAVAGRMLALLRDSFAMVGAGDPAGNRVETSHASIQITKRDRAADAVVKEAA
jgi:hypothetical protein